MHYINGDSDLNNVHTLYYSVVSMATVCQLLSLLEWKFYHNNRFIVIMTQL